MDERNLVAHGTVKVSGTVCNVTKLMAEKGKGQYNTLQGYSVSSNYVHMIVMIQSDTAAVLARGEGQDTISSLAVSDNKTLGHGNDCAYHNNFYIAQGGGKNSCDDILCFNSSFSQVGKYTYKKMNGVNALPTVSCIAHITGNYFFLGTGRLHAVCVLDKNTKIFQEVSRVELTKEDINLIERSGCEIIYQGIYYANNKLYKVFSHKGSNGKIQCNDIAVFSLSGNSPKFNKAVLSAFYSCDRTGKESFEIESVSSPDQGKTFYMATNQMEDTVTRKNSIYKIQLV